MVRRQVFHAFEFEIDGRLRALLNFCQRYSTRSVDVSRFAEQAVANALCGQAAFARFIKADFIGTR